MLNKIKRKLDHFIETKFNESLIKKKKQNKKKELRIKKDENYWNNVSSNILKAAEFENGKYFFRNKSVILHLAANDYLLGYKFLKKIKGHILGKELLNKCQTSPWGSQFIMRKYPSLSPSTAGHLANIISMYDSFGKEFKNFKNIVDFGGGYGGLAKCLCEFSEKVNIQIIDIEKMLKIQEKYILETSNFKKRIFFIKNLNSLKNKYCLFNASFSFSEVPLIYRKKVEKFIINNCNRIHIIYQNNFNNLDNIKYMDEFAGRLKSKKWKVYFKPYGYGSNSKFIMFGQSGKLKKI